MKGILHVVATPIGNLQDITLRAIDVLREVDFVVAENRSRALALLNHLGIRKPVFTINSYNEERKAGAILEQLKRSKNCALISAAGVPCISDPGGILVRRAREAGLEVRPVPGPSAFVAALSVSGLAVDRFLFYGFLPQKTGKKKKVLQELTSLPFAIVLYESPRRVKETVALIGEAVPGRGVAVLREITKLHEETIRGRVEEVLAAMNAADARGEYTIVIEGAGQPAFDRGTGSEPRASKPAARVTKSREKGSRRKRPTREEMGDYE